MNLKKLLENIQSSICGSIKDGEIRKNKAKKSKNFIFSNLNMWKNCDKIKW